MFPTVEATWTGVGVADYGASALCYLNGYVYVAIRGFGITGQVKKIDPATMTTVATWTGAGGENFAQAITTDGTYIYVGLGITPAKIIKIDSATMATIATWTGADASEGDVKYLEYDGTYIYASLYSTEEKVIRINPATMVTVDSLSGPCCAFTMFGDYYYAASGYDPVQVAKVSKATMSIVDTWTGDLREWSRRLTNDNTHIYVPTEDTWEENPIKVIKVDPAFMTTISTYNGTPDEIFPNVTQACIYDYGYIYLGLWSRIRRIDTSSMAGVDRFEDLGLNAAVLSFTIGNPKYLYAGLNTAPAKVLKFEIPAPAPPPAKGGSSALLLFAKMLMG